jgi:hypothetical protein
MSLDSVERDASDISVAGWRLRRSPSFVFVGDISSDPIDAEISKWAFCTREFGDGV